MFLIGEPIAKEKIKMEPKRLLFTKRNPQPKAVYMMMLEKFRKNKETSEKAAAVGRTNRGNIVGKNLSLVKSSAVPLKNNK